MMAAMRDGRAQRCAGWPAIGAWLAALCLLLLAPPAFGGGDEKTESLERSVKAAFLYKFLSYVEWPASSFAQPDAPIVIGVIGADDVAAALTQIVAGRSVRSRPLLVKRMKESEPLDGLQVLFVGREQNARLAQILRAAGDWQILTVTESEGGPGERGIINFLVRDGRVRFEVSLHAAEKAGVRLSSRLLAVAYAVTPGRSSAE